MNYSQYGNPYGYGQQMYGGQQQAGQIPYYGQGLQVPAPTNVPAPSQNVPGQLPIEESYIENILRLNKGKLATVYMTFENNTQWNAKVFKGIIEAAGRDHLILSDPQTGMRYLLPMIYLNYITFDEEIEYLPQFGGGQMAMYSPRP
ncbi:spore gernimation protein GerQ [Bacillus coahuilensis p1.1.43]|uniref:Spore coat protein GerQ n=1 Tax=Bacillus coahuilensis p1.1.43 TaxID=1150625 RepID=A0A147K431_9BACI|nr:spore coat protein GerQ [Bacillus coahuilensis]KUP04066.1 spore gernimation protein GerQ [Bacillus coahuilensis p1.1.43]